MADPVKPVESNISSTQHLYLWRMFGTQVTKLSEDIKKFAADLKTIKETPDFGHLECKKLNGIIKEMKHDIVPSFFSLKNIVVEARDACNATEEPDACKDLISLEQRTDTIGRMATATENDATKLYEVRCKNPTLPE